MERAMTRWQAFKIKVWNWCVNSGTIVWARLQIVVGVIFAGLIAGFSTFDWSQLASIDSKTLFKMLLASAISGVITEIVRRKGTVVETQVVSTQETNFTPVEVKKLVVVEPAPPPQG